MPIYLILAYVIFCLVPLYVGIRTNLRYRRVLREIEMRRAS
jgi:hypothetical protein